MNALVDTRIFDEKIRQAGKLQRLLEEKGMPNAAKEMNEIIRHASERRFIIAVAGEAKRGKSTLINGLLGRLDDEIAPIGKFPTTNMVTYYMNAKEESAEVFFSNGASPQKVPFAAVKDFVCEDRNPDNGKHVGHLEIRGDFPILGNDVCLADTPGANNALSSLHDILLLDFMPKADAVVFLVSAGTPITESEQKLLCSIRKDDARKLVFVINKTDKCTGQELEEAVAHNRKILDSCGFTESKIIPASAKNFFKTGHDSGTEEVLHTIKRMIETTSLQTLYDNLCMRIRQIVNASRLEVERNLELYRKSKDELEAEKAKLHEIQDSMQRNRGRQERTFYSEWDAASDDFLNILDETKKRMGNEYRALIEETPALQLDALGKTIHTDIMARMNELLSAPVEEFSARLQDAADHLKQDYCVATLRIPRDDIKLLKGQDVLSNAISTGSIALAGTPATLLAWGTASLPGYVMSAIAAAAPAAAPAVAITFNPFTWISAGAASVTTAATTSATAAATGAAAVILTPIASFLTPVFLFYGGYKMFNAWKYKKKETRNKLQIEVSALISDVFDEMRKAVRNIRKSKEKIMSDFYEMQERKIDENKDKIQKLLQEGPKAGEIEKMKELESQLENMR